MIKIDLFNYNSTNGAFNIQKKYALKIIDKFRNNIIGVEMGVAFGGGLAEIGQIFKDRGIVYGYDTFEGHPRHLYPDEANKLEGTCMQGCYDELGKEKISQEYIQKKLDEYNLKNVVLKKEYINKNTCSDINNIHYCLLDLDFFEPMKQGYYCVRDKIVPGGYLCIHDACPYGHFQKLYDFFYKKVLREESQFWEFEMHDFKAYMLVLKKKICY